ncbi:MAG: CPBP family intramembrane metalloprotease, partial [Bacteroidia bacterium]|nr:CPBP family intramembrane metalloprotease [Bacteroidia bacterium]
ITALVFSAIHGQFYGFIPRLILGAVLGYVYVFSGSIWIPIIMHFVNNGFAVVCSYTPVKEKLPLFLQDGYVFEEWYINTGSAILGSLLIFVIYLLSRKRILYNGE